MAAWWASEYDRAMPLDRIALWLFPESDFDAWYELVGAPEVADYGGYLDMLAAVQADQERQGRIVARVEMTVAEMIDALRKRGWENTPDRRAAVIVLE